MRNIIFWAALGSAISLWSGRAWAGVTPGDVKAGVDAWGRGDFEAAVRQWRDPAEAGDPDAQFNLAQAYRFGRGVPIDMQASESWYRRAAQQGHLRAQDNLGLLLFQQQAYTEAFPLLEAAAKRGDARAQYVLGTALFNGDLIGKDWPRAYALMLRAAGQGLDRAKPHLAEMNKYISPEEKAQGQMLANKMAQKDSAPVERPALPRAATTAAPPRAGWYVQLGAFSQAANARAFLATARTKLPVLAGYPVQSRPTGPIIRVLAGPLPNAAQASRLCATLRAAAQGCMPIAP